MYHVGSMFYRLVEGKKNSEIKSNPIFVVAGKEIGVGNYILFLVNIFTGKMFLSNSNVSNPDNISFDSIKELMNNSIMFEHIPDDKRRDAILQHIFTTCEPDKAADILNDAMENYLGKGGAVAYSHEKIDLSKKAAKEALQILDELKTKNKKPEDMQTQLIEKANNGYIVKHGKDVYVYPDYESLLQPYYNDLKNILSKSMNPTDKLELNISWHLNPPEIMNPEFEPEIDIEATLNKIGYSNGMVNGDVIKAALENVVYK